MEIKRVKIRTIISVILISLLGSLAFVPLASAGPDSPDATKTDKEPQDIEPVEETEKVITSPPKIINDYVPPPILRDLSLLPFPTRKMHELILTAAKSGEIEKLRPYIGYGSDITMLSLGGIDDDPISFLKTLSGDSDGHEVLAILSEVLEAGYVHVDEGTEQELFVWPYFFAQPIDKLTPKQRVELFSIVTYGDFEDMKAFGAYIFYRVGITPKGRWRFFVAGD